MPSEEVAKSCPECGADWPNVLDVGSTLVATGYLSQETTYQCTSCRAQWLHGAPAGMWENKRLECPVCEGTLQYHKRYPETDGPDTLHWKCPDCYYWTDEQIDVELENGELLAGYPSITGERE